MNLVLNYLTFANNSDVAARVVRQSQLSISNYRAELCQNFNLRSPEKC